MDSLATTFPFKDPTPNIESVEILQDGKVVSVTFDVADETTGSGDRAIFEFHFSSSWLHSASPLLCGTDYYRKNPNYYAKVCPFSKAVSAKVVKNGANIRIESKSKDGKLWVFEDTYPACFLFAYAPFTATLKSAAPERANALIQESQSVPAARSISELTDLSLISFYAQHRQKPWSRYPKGHPENLMNHDELGPVPTYDAEAVRNDVGQQRQLLLDICAHPGLVAVYNMEPPAAYDEDSVAEVLYDWFFDVFGKPNQHHSRKNQVFHICQKFGAKPKQVVSQDYDLDYDLNMHTDGVNYITSGSFLQANYQSVSDVTTRVCDGFACADYLKEKYPEYYDILTKTQVAHGMRHQLYDRHGIHSDLKKNQRELRARTDKDDFREVELINTRPVITVENGVRKVRDQNGRLYLEETTMPVQVNHCPVKIGVNTLKPDEFDKFIKAYEKWYDIVEGREQGIRGAYFDAIDWPQDTLLIFNNHRMLHGRAKILNPGIQEHIKRPVPDLTSQNGDVHDSVGSVDNKSNGGYVRHLACQNESNENGELTDKPLAKEIRRQMIGAYQNRGNSEGRLRLLTMKMVENQLSDALDMQVFSEYDNIKRDGVVVNGRDILARWFPRCPTKIIERMIPHSASM